MNQEELIRKFLILLDNEAPHYPQRDWYKTFLANKHRFYLNTEKLLNNLLDQPYSAPVNENKVKTAFATTNFLIKTCIKIIVLKFLDRKSLKELDQIASPTILKTFSYDKSFSSNEFHDPFLGNLGKYLEENGHKIVIVHEHFGSLRAQYNSKVKHPLAINLFTFVKISDMFTIFLFFFKNLIFKSHAAGSLFIYQNFEAEKISEHFYLHSFHYFAFKELLKKKRPGRVYSTFENNAWEKMLILAKNDVSPETEIFSHQHVPMAKSALNYFITENEKGLLPNKILTMGDEASNYLIQLGYPSNMIKSTCSLRLLLPATHTELFQRKDKHQIKNILVAFDGTSQAAHLADSIFKQLDFFETHFFHIVFRFHPAFGFSEMSKLDTRFSHFSPKYELSKNTLQADIKNADFIIYWGSTVAFEGLAQGKPVIQISGKELLSNDPINLEDGLHFNSNNLIQTIEQICQFTESEFTARQQKSIKYALNYCSPATTENLSKFL